MLFRSRRFKHDYNNILSSIEMYIENKDNAGLKDFYFSFIQPTRVALEKNFSALADLNQVHVPEIKSILTNKLFHAQNLGIHTTFICKETLSDVHFPSLDLVRVLGILLDNAIEANEKNPHDGRIEVDFSIYDDGVYIKIQNTCEIGRAHV